MAKKVRIKIGEREILADAGELLSDILDMEKPCGGQGRCKKCTLKVNGTDELACRYIIETDIELELPEAYEIESQTGLCENGEITENLCLALDVGTTTLALALVSLDEKKAVRVLTATNPQRKFGADVITRIEYCQKNGVGALQTALVEAINRMIAELGVSVQAMYVAANVTMLHTLFGVDCSAMGAAPYTPAFLEKRCVEAEKIGVIGVKKVISLPSVSAFVGADIVAGLNAVGIPEDGKYNMLIDLGTNAEIVLYSNRSGVATSAAAGPCFEGANISSGMSATRGAVCSFELSYGHAECKTVGDARAEGICGTGLIDIISELLKNGIIDESGYMERDYEIAKGVCLSVDDVRQYQLAKSAVYSAILALVRYEGIGFKDISRVYISGGFSSKINIPNAAASGLLPRELVGKTDALGNSSLQGTLRYACEGGDIERFVKLIKYVDLSEDPYFAKHFIENMSFS